MTAVDLGRREARVEVERVGSELGQRAGDLEEVTMVAAQDADGVARVDAGFDQPAGDCFGAGVEVAKAQRTAFVDERVVVAEAGGAHREERGGARAPVVNGPGRVPEAVGPFGADHAGTEDRCGRPRRVR